MKKTYSILLRVTSVAVIILICAWLFLWAYITYNKVAILEKVKAGISKQIKAKIEIENLSANFFYNFPNISIRLSNVSIKDSLWDTHHHDFLKAENVYVRLQFFSIFSAKPSVAKITVENAVIYYYTDTAGYSNFVKASDEVQNDSKNKIPDLLFINSRFIFNYPGHNKFYDIELRKMDCEITPNDSSQLLKIDIDAFVYGLGFNTGKGSCLKEKTLSGNFNLQFTKTKNIKFSNINLDIDKQPFLLSGNFSTITDTFSLTIKTQNINFKKAIGLLTQTTQQKFTAFNIVQPIDISAELTGLTLYKTIPLAHINFRVKEADIVTPAGQFDKCFFVGSFTNEINPDKPRWDDNSQFSFKNFTANWGNILLTANKIEISNLLQPFLKCDLHSNFELTALNNLTGSNTMRFIKGHGEMNINYKGSLTDNDTLATVMDGNILVKNAAINYLPRNITLDKLQGNFVFKNKDVFIEQLKAQAGSTVLNMNGAVKNLTELIYTYPEKLVLEWNVATPNLDLDDFINFLGKKSKRTTKKILGNSKLIRIANKIDDMLEYGAANLNVQATILSYKKFTATNFTTSFSLLQNQIILNNARFNHAGGTMVLSGLLTDNGAANIVKIQSVIANTDIPTLFKSFNNFGQDAITSQNMNGQLSATVNLTASLSDKGVINSNTINSAVDFSVLNGELNNFEPLQKVAASVFKKRDFSSIRFAALNNKLQVNGSAIHFDKMEIKSNIFTMFVGGVYDTKKGTDINIELPLSNLKKIADDEEIIKKGKTGLKIRLRAKTGEDGKLKISWNPFNKGNKTKQKR